MLKFLSVVSEMYVVVKIFSYYRKYCLETFDASVQHVC